MIGISYSINRSPSGNLLSSILGCLMVMFPQVAIICLSGMYPLRTTSLCPSASFRLRCCWINCSTSSSKVAAIIFLADSLTIFSSQSTASIVFFSSFLLIIVFIEIIIKKSPCYEEIFL